jgi:hypothetical protein
MKVVVGRAEVLFAHVGQALASEQAAVVPPMDLNRERPDRNSVKRVGEAQPIQDTGSIGANLDARADLAQLGRLLEHRNFKSRSAKCQRCRESADSCANHDNSHGFYSFAGRRI